MSLAKRIVGTSFWPVEKSCESYLFLNVVDGVIDFVSGRHLTFSSLPPTSPWLEVRGSGIDAFSFIECSHGLGKSCPWLNASLVLHSGLWKSLASHFSEWTP